MAAALERIHSNERDSQMSTTGEKPGKGTYICRNCGNSVTLDDATDTLPPCGKCHKTSFVP